MIPPKAVSLLIDHLDSIDAAVSKRLIRNRPWSEVSLTSLLCDLLDETTQEEERLAYPLSRLNADLAAGEGVLDLTFEIQTHEYPPEVERYVTQSDLGLVISYEDLLTDESWSSAWLLQAKRLSPNTGPKPQWTMKNRFGGHDKKQRGRMDELIRLVGAPFVKYLLYCPRPASLDPDTTKVLAHFRSRRLSNNIFDYALGMKLHEELAKPNSSLAAGMFVADPNAMPGNLREVHKEILHAATPFSWFIAQQFSPNPLSGRHAIAGLESEGIHSGSSEDAPNQMLRHGIVVGDSDAIKQVLEEFGEQTVAAFSGRFLPAHTMTVGMRAGPVLGAQTQNRTA